MTKVSMNAKVIGRRITVIDNLEQQLKSGVKTLSTRTAGAYEDKEAGDVVALTKHDINRINTQIQTLEGRV